MFVKTKVLRMMCNLHTNKYAREKKLERMSNKNIFQCFENLGVEHHIQ